METENARLKQCLGKKAPFGSQQACKASSSDGVVWSEVTENESEEVPPRPQPLLENKLRLWDGLESCVCSYLPQTEPQTDNYIVF